MDYYAIGQRVRRLRRARGLSQETLAELAEISTTHMSHIETGNTKLSLPVLAALTAALHTSADFLLFGGTASQKELDRSGIAQVLDACTPRQARLLAELVRHTKILLDQYE